MDRHTISVIIPAFNAEEHIERAIESVLGQTSPADEILVVDDGSTDQTAAKVRAYEPRIKYLFQKNAGANEARNLGIRQAEHNWIAFLDADDEWLPNKLHLQRQLLEHNPHLVWAYGNYQVVKEGDPVRNAHDLKAVRALFHKDGYFGDFFQAYANGIPVHTIVMIIKKSVLLEIGMFLPGQVINHDPDVALRLAYRFSGVGYSAQPLAIHYFGRTGGITQQSKALLEERKNFIFRHLKLSHQSGKKKSFEPCAKMLVIKWISDFQHNGFLDQALELLRSFRGLLPVWFFWKKTFSLKWPWVKRILMIYNKTRCFWGRN